jgi:hypothetical protein
MEYIVWNLVYMCPYTLWSTVQYENERGAEYNDSVVNSSESEDEFMAGQKKTKSKSTSLEVKEGKCSVERTGDTVVLTIKLGKGYKTGKGNTTRFTTGGNKDLGDGLMFGGTIYQRRS